MAAGKGVKSGRQFGPGFVYIVLGSGGRRKIGLSVNPTQRARDIGGDVEHVIRTTNMRWLEQYLHDAFYNQQYGRGEWYDLSDDDVAVLRGVAFADCEADLPHSVQALHAQPRPRWTIVKIDAAILPLARAAAALSGNITTQEYISNALNEEASKALGRPPLNRRSQKLRGE